MIPKIIHQIWLGPCPAPKTEMRTWKDRHPGWEYRLWDEEAISRCWPDGLYNQKQFDWMQELCGKADIARYEILHRFGGFYADADSVCLRPLDDWLLDNDSFACHEFGGGCCAIATGSPGRPGIRDTTANSRSVDRC